MIAPDAKTFSTAQARAALAGLQLAQVPAAPDAVPAFRLTGHAQQVDFSNWTEVVDFLKGAASHG